MKRAPNHTRPPRSRRRPRRAGCGGGSQDVPAGAVAVVDGTEISKAELDELLEQAKASYEAQQEFPKAGTPEYQSLQQQYVAYLVQRAEFEQAADELGVKVTDKDVDKAETSSIKTRFDGRARRSYEKALKEQGLTDESTSRTLRGVGALAEDLRRGHEGREGRRRQDVSRTTRRTRRSTDTPESRDVRHILIAEKVDPSCVPSRPTKTCKVDFAASKAKADQIYAELKGGADFAALAKENSADPGSKDTGGKLTISRGQTVPEFDKVAFELEEERDLEAREDRSATT